MTYTRKTKDEFVLMVNYWYWHGYEEEATEETMKEAKQRKKEYSENCPEYPTKIIKRRIKL